MHKQNAKDLKSYVFHDEDTGRYFYFDKTGRPVFHDTFKVCYHKALLVWG